MAALKRQREEAKALALGDAPASKKKYLRRGEIEAALDEKERIEAAAAAAASAAELAAKALHIEANSTTSASTASSNEQTKSNASSSSSAEAKGSDTSTTQQGDATGQLNLSLSDIKKRLRNLGHPVTLFGETAQDRANRLESLIHATEGGEMEIQADKDDKEVETEENKDERSDEMLVYRYFKTMLSQWELALGQRPETVKRTAQGKIATRTMKQCKDYIRPLFRLCKHHEVLLSQDETINMKPTKEVSLAPIHVVLWAIFPLLFLTILESLSYGLLVPVLPIATTEVVHPQVLHVVYPFTIMLFCIYNHDIHIYFIVKFVYNSFLTGSVVAASVADTISPHNRTTGTYLHLSLATHSSCLAYGGLFAIQSVFFSLAIALTEYLNTDENASFLLAVGISSMLSQGILLPLLIRLVREKGVVAISMLSYAVMSGLYLVVLATHSKLVVLAVAVCSGLGDIGFAAISSLKSTHVSEQVGRVQGALYAVRALASAIGPLAYSALYSAGQGKGAPFELSLALYAVATAVSCFLSSSDHSDHLVPVAVTLDLSVDSPRQGPLAPLLGDDDAYDDDI
ncbi:hypothetical protein DYB37_007660 [Aphanomyces astaci]|uniref:Pre-mRNA-splicing factor 18 n=1 Tax=Aphanomyces astaci TaxID=112090 RepID=A0A418F2G5_APHAT|nr:hypothetical protein DYB37_007660 [Aphanomyces astaci]